MSPCVHGSHASFTAQFAFPIQFPYNERVDIFLIGLFKHCQDWSDFGGVVLLAVSLSSIGMQFR